MKNAPVTDWDMLAAALLVPRVLASEPAHAVTQTAQFLADLQAQAAHKAWAAGHEAGREDCNCRGGIASSAAHTKPLPRLGHPMTETHPITPRHIELAYAAHPDERRTSFNCVVERTARVIAQVEGDLIRHVALLTTELAETKAGYHALDKNWERMHEAAMEPIRSALDLPDGTVLEIVTAIETLKQALTNPDF